MPKAIWNGVTLAESGDTIVIEGNHYFPPDSVNWEYFKKSGTHTMCPWKGQAGYYNLNVEGEKNEDAAWFYPDPKKEAEGFKDYVAFWRGVEVEA